MDAVRSRAREEPDAIRECHIICTDWLTVSKGTLAKAQRTAREIPHLFSSPTTQTTSGHTTAIGINVFFVLYLKQTAVVVVILAA